MIVGYDHRFGRNREDGFTEYEKIGRDIGMKVIKGEEYQYNDFQETKREFLFSDEFVANEIEQHCLGYWWGKGNIDFLDSSIILALGVGFNKNKIIEHCEEIEIFEQDVCKWRDAIVFMYYFGIRDEYVFTMADPYYFPPIYNDYYHTSELGSRRFHIRLDWKNKKISTSN